MRKTEGKKVGKDLWEYVDCYVGLVEDNKMYIPDINYSLLLEYNLNDWTYRCLSDFAELINGFLLRAMAIFKEGNMIYLVLRNTFRILIYDCETGETEFLGNQELYEDGEELIGNAFRVKKEIWMIPCDLRKNIQIFDITSQTFTEIQTASKINEREDLRSKEELWAMEGTIYEDSLYFSILETNYICQVLCKEKVMKIWTIDDKVLLHTISSYKGELWISDFQNRIAPNLYRWEQDRGIVETICLENCHWGMEDILRGALREVIAYQEKLVVIPRFSQEVIVINRVKRNQKKLPYPSEFQNVDRGGLKEMFHGITVKGEKVFLYPCAGNGILILDMKTEEWKFQELQLEKKDYRVYYQRRYRERIEETAIFREGECLPGTNGKFLLEDYIENIEPALENKGKTRKENGKDIYTHLTDN